MWLSYPLRMERQVILIVCAEMVCCLRVVEFAMQTYKLL